MSGVVFQNDHASVLDRATIATAVFVPLCLFAAHQFLCCVTVFAERVETRGLRQSVARFDEVDDFNVVSAGSRVAAVLDLRSGQRISFDSAWIPNFKRLVASLHDGVVRQHVPPAANARDAPEQATLLR